MVGQNKRNPSKMQGQDGEEPKELMMKVVFNSNHPSEMSPEFDDYIKSDVPTRQAFIKNQSKVVRFNITHSELLQKEHVKFVRKLKSDPQFRTWRYGFVKEYASGISHRFAAQKSFLGRFSAKEGRRALENDTNKTSIYLENLHKYIDLHIPSTNRIQVMKNLTFNALDVIPVFCDIKGKPLSIPKELTFEYTDHNIINRELDPLLVKALELAEKDKRNMIRCDCAATGFAHCFDNPQCPCYEMNRKLGEFQTPVEGCDRVKFNTLDPILFPHVHNVIWEHVAFACSDACGCMGNCTNNPMLMAEKKMIPLEVYRANDTIGFSVRSPVFIPAGTPVMPFTGEIINESRCNDETKLYSFQSHYTDDYVMKAFIKKQPFTNEYKGLLAQFNKPKSAFVISPLEYGNVGRMAGHSCVPNMEIVRVYRKSLSPAHVSLLMVTILDAVPGTPLTIDYGLEYAGRLECLCGAFACANNTVHHDMKDLDVFNLAQSICKIQVHKEKIYKKEVLEPLKRYKMENV